MPSTCATTALLGRPSSRLDRSPVIIATSNGASWDGIRLTNLVEDDHVAEDYTKLWQRHTATQAYQIVSRARCNELQSTAEGVDTNCPSSETGKLKPM